MITRSAQRSTPPAEETRGSPSHADILVAADGAQPFTFLSPVLQGAAVLEFAGEVAPQPRGPNIYLEARNVRALLPEFAHNLFAGDIFEAEAPWADGRRYALAILMPGRLLEVSRESAERLTSRLKRHADALLVYSYDAAGPTHDALAHVRLASIP